MLHSSEETHKSSKGYKIKPARYQKWLSEAWAVGKGKNARFPTKPQEKLGFALKPQVCI